MRHFLHSGDVGAEATAGKASSAQYRRERERWLKNV
jgi:hypothetical protein